ncbi:MAG: hypothetical protein M3336_11115 [Chloroflexota bacterium]|nr:hypothetical protein [Chloroflexota bacterium]
MQVLFWTAVLWFVSAAIARQWREVRAAAAGTELRWEFIAASCAVVFLTYALLIEVWRVVLRGWDARLPFAEAARIWVISNLGRYVPGKVWQLGSMAMMAREQGVPGVAAAGSAIAVTLLHTVAGFIVVAVTGMRVLDISRAGVVLLAALSMSIVLLPWLLPPIGTLAGRVTGRSLRIPPLPARLLWFSLAASAVAWVMYGLAFRLFAVGVLGHATGAAPVYIAVFTGSYLLGFLALFAPGGLVVREAVMASALAKAGTSAGAAIVLVIASRLWLTALEIVPALCFLAHRALRRGPRCRE